jgi:hypothetical protein
MKRLTFKSVSLYILFSTICTLSCVLVPFGLNAQDGSNDNNQSIVLVIDQDFFAPSYNNDQNYTMGFSLGYTGNLASKSYLFFPKLRFCIDELFNIHDINSLEFDSYGLSIMLSAFTPFDLEDSDPIVTDRPYGSILAISSHRTTVRKIRHNIKDKKDLKKDLNSDLDKIALTTRLNIGLLGLPIAREVQSYIHRKRFFGTSRPIPLGWHNQISNGGELTFLYQIHAIKPVFILDNAKNDQFKFLETNISIESNLGYYTNLAMGFGFRIGKFKTNFWELSNLGMSAINQISLKPTDFDYFFFMNIRGRAVLYNALLQGQFKDNQYELSRNQINPFITELDLGFVIRFYKLTAIYQPIILRTQEFDLPDSRTHVWGNLTLSYAWL